MATGKVRWFSDSKGCGFITPDDGGADLFAHHSSIEGIGRTSLIDNQRVCYDKVTGPKGEYATNIQPA